VTVGDFNHDGRYDIAGAGPAGVSISTGDGGGSFTSHGVAVQRPNLSTALGGSPAGVKPDLVVATSSGVLVVNFASDLSFSGTPLQAGTAPAAVVTADITGDGLRDVIALDQAGDAVNAFVATAGAYTTPVSIPVDGKPVAMAVGRFNSDTRADVVVATDQGVTVLLGRR
jgi:hypothetical protein